jgi:pimeloyl-ACP methyl ester carboxylesterase
MVGSGPDVVLLHGFLSDSRAWAPQIMSLRDAHRVIAWDAPGAGASEDPEPPFTLADWVECLRALLITLGVQRAHVVGLSWGGLLAQELLRLYPETVRSLVLAGTYAGWTGSFGAAESAQRLRRCLADSDRPPNDLVKDWVPQFFAAPTPDLLEEMSQIVADFHPEGFRSMARSLDAADTTSTLDRVDVPTMLIWGAEDERSPLSVAEQFRSGIAGARLHVIPGAGHVSNLERPDEFTSHIRDFFGDQSSRQGEVK